MDNGLDLRGINFEEGYIAVVDKPLEWTSADVVRKIKFALRRIGFRRIRVGPAAPSIRWPRACCWSASDAPRRWSTPCRAKRKSTSPT